MDEMSRSSRFSRTVRDLAFGILALAVAIQVLRVDPRAIDNGRYYLPEGARVAIDTRTGAACRPLEREGDSVPGCR